MEERITVRYPEYYPLFACTGGACPDTCCASWQIGADSRSVKRYQRVEGEFGKRLRAGIDEITGEFRMKGGRCPFLNKENLCDMYLHLGKDSLCRTCRSFPRHIEDYGYVRELSLSLACPEAARLILSGENQEVRIKTTMVSNVNPVDEEELDFLWKLRDVCFYLLDYGNVSGQGKKPPIGLKMVMILALAHDVQRHRRRGDAAPEEVLTRYTRRGVFERFAGRLSRVERETEQQMWKELSVWFTCLKKLEPVSEEWRALTKDCMTQMEGYTGVCVSPNFEMALTETELESLLRYYLYLWLPGAVYDGKPYLAVKMAVVSCLLIELVCRMEGVNAVTASHLWARELEHSTENLNKTERLLMKSQAFSWKCMLNAVLFCFLPDDLIQRFNLL